MSAIPRAVRRPLGEPGPLGRAWRWALAIAAAVTTLVACLFPLVNATYDARLARDEARAPSIIAYVSDLGGKPMPRRAVALYSRSFEDVRYSHVEIVWLQNLKPDATPPPGLDHWPGPREAIASPGLLSAHGGREFAHRYGTVTGEISNAGLVNPHEKLLYVGIDPAVSVTATATVIDGFGAPGPVERAADGSLRPLDQGYLGDVLYQWDRSGIYVVLALFAVAPCLVLIGVAVRLGGERRDQYAAWLTAIGAAPNTLRRFLLRESLGPLGLGCLAGLGVVGLAMAGTWPVPGIGSVIVGSFLRPAWWKCLLAALLAAVVILLALLGTHRVRPRPAGATPRASAGRSRPWLVLVLVVLIAAESWFYAAIYPTDPGAASTYAALTAALVVVLLAPCGGAFLALAGRSLTRFAHRTGSPSALATSAELRALPRPALRTSAVIAAAIVVTVQALLLMAGPTQNESAARAAVAADPGLVADLGEASMDDSWLPRAASGLPADLATIRVEYKDGDSTAPVAVRATCDQIQRLGTPCPTGPTTFGQLLATQKSAAREALTRRIPPDIPVQVVATPRGQTGNAVIVSTDGQRIDPGALTTQLAAFVSPTPYVTRQWSGWLIGATTDLAYARWLLVAGALTAVILFIAAALALWFEAVRVARRMASLAMLIDRRRTSSALGIGLVGVPIAASTVLGILAALGFAISPTSVPGSGVAMPWGYFALVAVIGAVLSIGTGLLAARVIRAHGARWIPADADA